MKLMDREGHCTIESYGSRIGGIDLDNKLAWLAAGNFGINVNFTIKAYLCQFNLLLTSGTTTFEWCERRQQDF